MAYTRTYRTIVPLEAGGDADVLRWLARESFDRMAAGDCLRIIEFTEVRLKADEIPPKAAQALGRPATDYQWFAFTAAASA